MMSWKLLGNIFSFFWEVQPNYFTVVNWCLSWLDNRGIWRIENDGSIIGLQVKNEASSGTSANFAANNTGESC